ncbi:MAG TPA: hypothetical protein PLQ76_02045 [bacterium]|nr:hypothetical protein [bacterium]
MLSKDVKIIDIDPDQYERAVCYFLPEKEVKEKSLIIFYSENKVLHAVHSEKGPVAISGFRGPGSLKDMASSYSVDRVICLEKYALRRLAAGCQSKISMEDTLSAQITACREPFSREWKSGIHIYPDPAPRLPKVSENFARLLRFILPKNFLSMIVVFDGREIWTSLITNIKEGEITLISTTDSLQPFSFPDDAINAKSNILNGRIKSTHGQPDFCIYLDKEVFYHLTSHPKPFVELARFIRKKWVHVDPFPRKIRFLMMILSIFRR